VVHRPLNKLTTLTNLWSIVYGQKKKHENTTTSYLNFNRR
jgi:hypothetical protein